MVINFEERDMSGTAFGATIMLALMLFGILVAILWVLMPFAIFGTKDLLRTLIQEQKRTNELLQAQVALQQIQADRAREVNGQAVLLRADDMTAKS